MSGIIRMSIAGTALLILSAVDVDSSNKSYYGEQTVHLVNVMTGLYLFLLFFIFRLGAFEIMDRENILEYLIRRRMQSSPL